MAIGGKDNKLPKHDTVQTTTFCCPFLFVLGDFFRPAIFEFFLATFLQAESTKQAIIISKSSQEAFLRNSHLDTVTTAADAFA